MVGEQVLGRDAAEAHNAAAAAARPSPVTRRDASAERVVSSRRYLPR